jgi:hypothetical protein
VRKVASGVRKDEARVRAAGKKVGVIQIKACRDGSRIGSDGSRIGIFDPRMCFDDLRTCFVDPRTGLDETSAG